MAIALQNLIVRSRRRVRAVFSEAVASGGFVAGFYAITSLDSLGANPAINGVLVVPDSPHVVELSLAIDLADGGHYRLDVAAGVPAVGGSTSAASSYQFAAPNRPPPPSPELPIDDALAAVYGADIAWFAGDFLETATGDLATRGGIQNATDALTDRCLSDGLAWDDTYGARPREFVDGADEELPTLRARMVGQVLLDDRVLSASGSSTSDPGSGSALIELSVVLVGQTSAVPVSVPVN